MHKIIILKKILRLNSKSVCAELLDSFLAFVGHPRSTPDTKHVEINLKNYSIIVEGDDLSLERTAFAERRTQIWRVYWMEWSGSECTANNYNIRRGLLTGFVIYQVRGSFLKGKEEVILSGRENRGTRDKTIVMEIKKVSVDIRKRDQINQIFGSLHSLWGIFDDSSFLEVQ
jgi:hypothetical protein